MTTQVDKAYKIMREAQRLRELDSLDAIPQVARLSRRFPGWLTLLVAAALVLLLAFAAFVLCSWIAFNALLALTRALQGFVILAYPGYKTVWAGCFAALLILRLWRNDRWRELLQDDRFALSADVLNPLWVAILWPLRIAVEALRLCIALLFQALVIAPQATAIAVILRAAVRWRAGALEYPESLVMMGFTAGALYLILGLLRGWRVDAASLRWRPKRTRPSWMQTGMAALIAILSGAIVAVLAPIHQAAAGGVAGLLYFLLWLCWLVDWRITGPRQLLQRPQLELSLSEAQVRFLEFTLFLLWVAGLPVMGYYSAEHWPVLRSILPGLFVHYVQVWTCGALPSSVCIALEPWLMGRAMINILIAAGSVRLIGLDLTLARPFAWPFFVLRAAAESMMARVRARLAILAAVQYHRQRNRRLVGKHGQKAICREHLARFKRRQVRLAYGLRWRYWSCRYCGSDVHAIPNIAVLRAAFDQDMRELLKQEGDVLAINMLRHDKIPLDLQELFVARVQDDHDVEKFITTYENQRPNSVKVPELNRIRLRISPESNLGDNQRNMLRSKCRT